MADREFIIAPVDIKTVFRVEQASVLLNSLHLLVMGEYSSGFDQWIYDTWNALTPGERLHHKIVMEAVHDDVCDFNKVNKFEDFLKHLETVDMSNISQQVVAWMAKHEELPSPESALESEDSYIDTMREWFKVKDHKGMVFDETQWREMYRYLQAPDKLHSLMMEHLTMMWERFLKPEWDKRKAMLEEAVKVHSQMDYKGLSHYEVIEAVTGRDMRGSEYMSQTIDKVSTLIFIPSPHVGPYIGFTHEESAEYRLFFGARLPKGSTLRSSALNRSELLVRLGALADDTRLRMIELLIEHQELCAQDFITLLDLSQSSASRHLRQLTASGYLQERRKEVAKCYSLNPDRIEDTITALRQFLVTD